MCLGDNPQPTERVQLAAGTDADSLEMTDAETDAALDLLYGRPNAAREWPDDLGDGEC